MSQQLGKRDIWTDVALIRTLLGTRSYLPFTTGDFAWGIDAACSPFYCTIGRSLNIMDWSQAVYVDTTNTGANYWTIILERVDLVDIATLTTAAIAPDAWTLLTAEAVDYDVSRTDVAVKITVGKTGNPGTLYLAGPAVWVV